MDKRGRDRGGELRKERLHSSLATEWFLALVRTSLWGRLAATELCKVPILSNENGQERLSRQTIDWDALAETALKQTVGPAVFKASLSLPEDLLPPKEWARKAYAFLERNRRTGMLADSCVAEASETLKRSGLNPVLLKGQAYARYYPERALRQCGDIDLYVGERDYLHAYHTANDSGWKSEEEFMPKGKHYGCTLRGVRVELHRLAAELSTPRRNRNFQQWSFRQLTKNLRKIIIDGREISVPSGVFDMVFVFLHLYHHFIFGGIGLRHVCDWVMILHAHSGDSGHEEELDRILNETGLKRAWQFFTPIAVNYLGLPEKECPFYTTKNLRMAERILSLILKEGNFGRGRGEKGFLMQEENFYIRKIRILRQFTRMMLPRFRIDPERSTAMYLRTLSRGGKSVVLHLFKRKPAT